MRVGIYGGTFDPPHLGHMEAARAAADALELDQLIFVPAKMPPHKPLPKDSASPEQRLEMTRMMADGLLMPDRVQVDSLELEREGKSYTSDTVQQLHKRWPDSKLWLLMGSDMFVTLPDWHKAKTILNLARIAAFARSETDTAEALAVQAKRLHKEYGAKARIISVPKDIWISSSEVRREGTGRGLWPPIWGYILRHGLYGTHADLTHLSDDDLRACSLSMVYAKRHAHILGVEQTAVELAKRWGADPELARRAAILHDCTKYLDLNDQLKICSKYDILLDSLEGQSAKLLHAKTGAALAKYVYGQPEEVCQAIYWHTTGRPNMTLLDKIIYLADYIEPNRDFDGVEKLRQLCRTDLDGALLLGLEMSITDLKSRDAAIHANTSGAYDWVLARRSRKG